MKKFVTIIVTISIMFAIAFAIADEVERYGGHEEYGFIQFIDNAKLEEPEYYGRIAFQRLFFENGYHIIAECECNGDVDEAKEMTIDVYDPTGWVVGDRYIIENSEDGEHNFYDLLYRIYKGEL